MVTPHRDAMGLNAVAETGTCAGFPEKRGNHRAKALIFREQTGRAFCRCHARSAKWMSGDELLFHSYGDVVRYWQRGNRAEKDDGWVRAEQGILADPRL